MNHNLFFLGLLFISAPIPATAQNLIRNGSFEEHGEQRCLECNTLGGQYPGLVYHWDNGGWGCQLLDKGYKRSSDDNKWKGSPFDKMSPNDGKAMIEMWYLPGCGGGEYMCATYLSGRSTKPIRVGQLYEASFWLYIESSKRADPDRAKHIGIALLPENIEYHAAGGRKRLILPFLGVDTVIYDAWYQVKWRIRPLCTSNYFTIGLFADYQWPTSRSFDDLRYFVDKVSLTEIPTQSGVIDSSVYYCSRYDPVKLGTLPKMDNEILLFENDSYALTPAHKTDLDSFVVYAKKYPYLVFELSGHTDSIGSANILLSQNRVQSVFKYLVEEHKLPEFRFILLSMGSKDPYRLNHTEEGRKLNRRVEIRQSSLDLPNMFYRRVLKAVASRNVAEAFAYLNKWMIKPNRGDVGRLIVRFDPRLDLLHKDKRWADMDQKIRDEYRKFKYPHYSYLIDSLRFDQLSASGLLTSMGYQAGLNTLPGYIPELDSVLFEMDPMSDAEILKRYEQHFAALRPILAKTGWPKKSEFGESACNAAFSILMNSKVIVEYLNWLPEVEKSCTDGETPWIFYARLYDQCRRSLGKPQRYLTQAGMLESGEIWIEPWEGDEDSVNDLRAKIGLPLLRKEIVEAMKNQK